MVHLILSSTKGNQGHRYFPYAGYLGLTPIRVEGIVRTKLDVDQKPLQAKSITISVRCYESRIGRVGTSATNLLVDYTQVLWQKPPTTHFEPITNFEFPFRIVVPPRVAGFSTAVFVDYRCMWRVEAVLTHAPITGVGSRQIRHFELPLVRYDVPPPLPPLLSSIPYAPYPSPSSSNSSTPVFLHETSKPRAPRIRYTVHAPRTPIGPHDQVAIPIHIQSVDAHLTVRSASIIVERRIVLHDATTVSSSSAPIPIPIPSPGAASSSSSQPNSASRSYPSSSSPAAADATAPQRAGADDYPSQKKRPNTSPFPAQHASSSSSFFGLGSSSSKNTSSSSSSRPASSSSKSRPSSSGKEKEKEKSSGFAPFGFLTLSSSSSVNRDNHLQVPGLNDSQLSFGSGATVTQSAVSLLSSESTPLLGPSFSSSSYSSSPSPTPTPASPPASASTPKALVHNIAFAESTGAFARVQMPMPSSTSDPPMPQTSSYFANTLTLAWPAAKGQSRWTVGSTIASSDIASVRFFLRTKVVVTYNPNNNNGGTGEDGYSGGGGGSAVTESLELREEEVLVVGAGEAERRAAVEALGGMFGGNSGVTRGASASREREREEAGEGSGADFDAAAWRGKSKSPRRVGDRERDRERERERERDWDNAAAMPSPPSMQDLPSAHLGVNAGPGMGGGGASIISSSGSSGRTVRLAKSAGAMRRPHTSAGYAERTEQTREKDIDRESKRQTASGGSVPLATYNTSGSGTEGSGSACGSGSGQISATSSSSSSSDAHNYATGYAPRDMLPPPSAYTHSAGSTGSGGSSGRRRADGGAKENTAAPDASVSSSRDAKGDSKREKRQKERRPDTSSGLVGGPRGAQGFWSTVHSNPPLSSASPSASAFAFPGGGRSGRGSGGGSGRPSTSAGVSSHSSSDKERAKGGILGSFVLGGLGALAGSGSTITPVVSSNSAGEYCGTRSTGSTASDSSATTSSSGRSAGYSNSNSNSSAASGRSHRQHTHRGDSHQHQHHQRPLTAGSTNGGASATTPTGGPRGRSIVAPAGASGAEREWEEELARIEARSRRSSDMLGFNVGMKARGASRPPTASAVPVPPVPVDLGLSMLHAGHLADM